MRVMEDACPIAGRTHYTRSGAGNRDCGTWSGIEPHRFSLGQLVYPAQRERIAIAICHHVGIA